MDTPIDPKNSTVIVFAGGVFKGLVDTRETPLEIQQDVSTAADVEDMTLALNVLYALVYLVPESDAKYHLWKARILVERDFDELQAQLNQKARPSRGDAPF